MADIATGTSVGATLSYVRLVQKFFEVFWRRTVIFRSSVFLRIEGPGDLAASPIALSTDVMMKAVAFKGHGSPSQSKPLNNLIV